MAGRTINLPPFKTWNTNTLPVGQAAKIIEEAAEVLEEVNEYTCDTNNERVGYHLRCIAYECMDVVQAVCNLMEELGIDRTIMWNAYNTMMESQRERGRL